MVKSIPGQEIGRILRKPKFPVVIIDNPELVKKPLRWGDPGFRSSFLSLLIGVTNVS